MDWRSCGFLSPWQAIQPVKTGHALAEWHDRPHILHGSHDELRHPVELRRSFRLLNLRVLGAVIGMLFRR